MLMLAPVQAGATTIEFAHMQRLDSDATRPPGAADTNSWTDTALPHATPATPEGQPPHVTWYRARFDAPALADSAASWAIYLPFFYQGGQIWVNGSLVGNVPESTPDLRVRWERPHLITLPTGVLQPRNNLLAVRVAAAPLHAIRHFPRVAVGPLAELQARADRRTFWVRTMPQITVVVCLLVAGFVLFIYWRRRSEVLYGLFGLAAALWGVRTLTFVIERMPVNSWQMWRITYLAATGGFIVVLALFALRFAGIRRPAIEKGLVAYWLVGPICLWLAGADYEGLINQLWSAGLMPIGVAILGLSVWSMLRQRTLAAAVMPVTLVIAVLAGVHDYMVAWNVGLLARWAPYWASQRIFLLHYGANLMLLGMGGLLTARFIEALSSLQTANRKLADLNETLELRVAERERHLAANFERMADLQRDRAAAQERQLIMREIHDGLGSRLFTSLLRVERGDMDDRQIADTLRDCIADMRLALEALAPDDDFQAALGNFLFRWQTQMQEAHIQPAWAIDVPDSALNLPRQAVLQLLRIAQEALTNVLKHARAKNVRIELRQRSGMLELEVVDDGIGADLANGKTGRGIGNMRARARQLGGNLDVHSGADGTRVLLRLPLSIPAGAAATVDAVGRSGA
ncbi:MAG: beta galactosidase jelly roll domain-containing protein [Ferruginibacter sp.]|nr:beta galactosidase jelly roll domain-containing protein [Rhodoferax sp.]